MKVYSFVLPVGFQGSGKALLALGKRGDEWGVFCYPTEEDETKECAQEANRQFEDWFIILETKEGLKGWRRVAPTH